MCREFEIYFDNNPSEELIISMMKELCGLDLKAFGGNGSILELTHPTSPRHHIELISHKRGTYLEGKLIIERDYISLRSFTPELNYLEGLALTTLKNLGGQLSFNWFLPAVPAWASSKWLGEDWWKKVGSKPSFFERLIEKFL